MSGIRRQILAELAAKGTTGEEAQNALTAEGFREESGRAESQKQGGDDERYTGKMAPKQQPS